MPALLTVAERLCEPCKVPPEGRRGVPPDVIGRRSSSELGVGPFGEAASPTRVGAVRVLPHHRAGKRLAGAVGAQVDEAVALLERHGAFREGALGDAGTGDLTEEAVRSVASGVAIDDVPSNGPPVVAVLCEPERPGVGAELLGAASRLAGEVGASVVAIRPEGADGTADLAAWGADEVLVLAGDPVEEDVATSLANWVADRPVWALLAPSTAFGREVTARLAAVTGSGLVGDAIALDVVDGRLVAAKPAFSGALVADIWWTGGLHLVTVRPGVLPVAAPRPTAGSPVVSERTLGARGRVRVLERRRDDDVEVLARAAVVIGVGTGVAPDEYVHLEALAAVLGAELAATRKVTDNGWAPRARQVGITGRSIAPRLYVAVGLSGKFNHMAGVRGAGSVLAINRDPDAPVFGFADVGIVADWREAVPLLAAALRSRAVDAAAGRVLTRART